MALLKEVCDKLKGFLRKVLYALDQVDLATAPGKALDQLRDSAALRCSVIDPRRELVN